MTQFLALRSAPSGPALTGTNQGDVPLWDVATQKWYTGPPAGGGAVSSVFGRTGAVVALTGDYDSDQVDNLSSVTGPSVSDALDWLLANAGAVSSVFGRIGAVVAAANDYLVSQVTGAWQQVQDLAERNAIPIANREIGMTVYEVDTDQMWRLIGGTANANWVDVTVTEVTNLRAGIVPVVGVVSTILQSTGTASNWVAPLTWDSAFPSPTIQQQPTGGASGQRLTVRGQNAATTGGGAELGSGTGGTTPGEVRLFTGATQVGSFQRSFANDFLALGDVPSLTGALRLAAGQAIRSRDSTGAVDLAVYTSDVAGAGTNVQTFGSASNTRTNIDSNSSGGIGFRTASTDRMSVGATSINFLVASALVGAVAGGSGFTFSIVNINSASAGGFLRLRGQGSSGAGFNGAAIEMEGGRFGAGGLSGAARMKLNQDDTQANMWTMLEAAHLATGRRVVALARAANITTAEMGANTGDLVTFIGNALTIPSADAAVSGHIYYSDGARPAWRFNSTNLRLNGTSASATAGAGGALPVTVEGYLDVQLNGTQRKVPYYAA